MDLFNVAKIATHIVTSFGVTKVLNDVIKNNTTVVTTTDKVLVKVGSFVLSSMVLDSASKRVTKMLDGLKESNFRIHLVEPEKEPEEEPNKAV